METTRGWQVVLISILVLATTSCRFRLPSTNEGQVLAERGAFPSSLPGWVKAPDDMGAARANRGGLVPQGYGAAKVVQTANAGSGSNAIEQERRAQEKRSEEERESQRAVSTQTQGESSPLDRIEQLCPGLEDEVTEALKTIEIKERIQQYERLSVKCPNSADIWFWLAQDYHKTSRFAEAVRSYEQVLVLDPQNQAAQALADEARQLNASSLDSAE